MQCVGVTTLICLFLYDVDTRKFQFHIKTKHYLMAPLLSSGRCKNVVSEGNTSACTDACFVQYNTKVSNNVNARCGQFSR